MGAAAGTGTGFAEAFIAEGDVSCPAVAYGRRTEERRKRHWPHIGRIRGCSIVLGRNPLATRVPMPPTG